MNKLQLMSGVDIPVPEIEASIHQPTVMEISYLGELEYFTTMQLLCFNKDILIASNPKGASVLSVMNNFQIFMTLITDPKVEDVAQKKNNILSMFTILFPGYTCQFLPTGLFFNNAQTKHNFTLNENNFDAVKSVLSEVSCINSTTGGQNSSFKPTGKKAAEIAAKIMKSRARVAKEKGYSVDGTLARYVSILTVGLNSMSLKDCLNCTVYQIYDLIERFGLNIGWDLDIKSRLAGAKPDDKPDDWMKDIH